VGGVTGDPAGATSAVAESSLSRARQFLTRIGMQASDDDGLWTPLTGGVSSDLWRVELPGRTVCVKGALAQLRVADDWQAPVSRNAVEYAWLQFAARQRPANVPQVYARDDAAGFFVMEYLDARSHPTWKAQLLAGVVDQAFAGAVGDLVGALQAASARDADVPRRFATYANFAVLRLDPYLRTTAARSPLVADRLNALADRTAAVHLALVHGDVSPKNILVGPAGPVLLDAECAWFGDPAFDVAFCLTHIALKMVLRPAGSGDLLAAGSALVAAHASHVEWEDVGTHAGRAAALLPALLLARVDGSSPVEYLDDEQRELVRRTATRMLQTPQAEPTEVLQRWRQLTAAG